MGAEAMLIGSVLGSGLMAYTMGNSMKRQNDTSAQQLMSLQNQQSQTALDTLPDAPEAIDTGKNEEAEAARMEQQKQMAANERAVNPTGGMGVSSRAGTKKKTLGGA